ncbi:MAG TPA: polysaccharide biosynthesis/export family protein [Lacipirellula sp.]
MKACHRRHCGLTWLMVAVLAATSGCTAFMEPRNPVPVTPAPTPPTSPVPRELEMVTMPRYTIAPPDILLVEGVKLVPKSPHRIETFDVLLIRAVGAFPEQPIDNTYNVDADGTVNLGPTYGRVRVVDLTIEEAEDAIRDELSQILTDVEISVSLVASAGAQAVTGQHLVAMDGRVNLGTYGAVYVAGLTIDEAREAIETKLSERLEDPEVYVDVLAYNSKVFYVITQGAGLGDDVTRLPITGNETVIDAVAALGGISQVSSTRMWIARPAPNGVGCEQILPVNWNEIAQGASTATNYQLMPGDRLFIAQDRMTAFNTVVGKILNPFERILGFVSLGTSTANRIVRFGLANTF